MLCNLDEICDRFEVAWREGRSPAIEDYLDGVSESLRSRLLGELVALDVAYRRAQGQMPALSEYEGRFADEIFAVREGFGGDDALASKAGRGEFGAMLPLGLASDPMASPSPETILSCWPIERPKHFRLC